MLELEIAALQMNQLVSLRTLEALKQALDKPIVQSVLNHHVGVTRIAAAEASLEEVAGVIDQKRKRLAESHGLCLRAQGRARDAAFAAASKSTWDEMLNDVGFNRQTSSPQDSCGQMARQARGERWL